MTDIRLISRYSGFTFVEMLVVFIVALFLIGLPNLLIEKTLSNVSGAQFFSSFEKYFLSTQQLAVVGDEDTVVHFFEEKQQFLFTSGEKQEYLQIPPELKATGPTQIIFKKGTGNNGRLSKYSFEWSRKKQLIEFQLQMGSGKYVKKITGL